VCANALQLSVDQQEFLGQAVRLFFVGSPRVNLAVVDDDCAYVRFFKEGSTQYSPPIATGRPFDGCGPASGSATAVPPEPS